MRPTPLLATLALAAGTCLLTQDSAVAGGGWAPLWKPDLRILSIELSGVSPNHARLIVTNQGAWSSPACWAKLTCYGPVQTGGYAYIPAMTPGAVVGTDGWAGQFIAGSPGQMTVGWIDCLQDVAESNEGNNIGIYIAPAH